ncbi:MAG: response regulator [Gammaproteobacteria bacterium]|nr:response regulator [Gammaproteobacteria bacterium]
MIIRENDVELLLIEDDDIDAKAIQRSMKKLKIANRLHRAKDGIEALEMLRNGDINKPFLILLDINMPRMNGLDFLEEIRGDNSLKDTIVFMLTTSKAEEDRVAAFEHNVAGYMVKSDLEDGFASALELVGHYWRIVEMPK